MGHEHSGGGVFFVLDDKEPAPGALKSQLPKGSNVKAVACGGWHTLALVEQDSAIYVYSWGNGSAGQLGHNNLSHQQFPEIIKTLSREVGHKDEIVAISAGALHSVAVTRSGKVFTWGKGEQGQLGLLGRPLTVTVPQKVEFPAYITIESVSCGAFHTLLLSRDGVAYSMGMGKVNTSLPRHTQLDPHFVRPDPFSYFDSQDLYTEVFLSGLKAIAAGDGISVALTSMHFSLLFLSAHVCTYVKYLGEGDVYVKKTNREEEVVEGLTDITEVAASWTHIAAITSDHLYLSIVFLFLINCCQEVEHCTCGVHPPFR